MATIKIHFTYEGLPYTITTQNVSDDIDCNWQAALVLHVRFNLDLDKLNVTEFAYV